jgi:hypothetical protein
VSSHGSRFWHAAFRFQYRILALIDPLVRRFWRRFGIGNVVDLSVAHRKGSGDRSRFIGLLRVGERRYVGHPNGDVGWTRDLEAAGSGSLEWHDGRRWRFSARRLEPGIERESVVLSTGQHPFPGNLMYRLGRRQVRGVGVFFRLDEEA